MIIPQLIPRHMAKALSQVGVAERAGNRHNPQILEYLRSLQVGLPMRDETAWCSAYVSWCFDGPEGPTGLARSWLKWGVDAHATFGAVTVISRGTKSWQGHVGFLVGASRSTIYMLGGNQGNRVSIQGYAADRLLGYRLPIKTEVECIA